MKDEENHFLSGLSLPMDSEIMTACLLLLVSICYFSLKVTRSWKENATKKKVQQWKPVKNTVVKGTEKNWSLSWKTSNWKAIDFLQQKSESNADVQLNLTTDTFEKCVEKLPPSEVPNGQEMQLVNTLLDMCGQERMYFENYGLISAHFCASETRFTEAFERCFVEQYSKSRESNELKGLRNTTKLFAHLLCTDSMSWRVCSAIQLNESETTASSRIFLRVLLQEIAKTIGSLELKKKLLDTGEDWFSGMFPHDSDASNIRYAIQFYNSMGLRILTDSLQNRLEMCIKQRFIKSSTERSFEEPEKPGNKVDSSIVYSASTKEDGSTIYLDTNVSVDRAPTKKEDGKNAEEPDQPTIQEVVASSMSYQRSLRKEDASSISYQRSLRKADESTVHSYNTESRYGIDGDDISFDGTDCSQYSDESGSSESSLGLGLGRCTYLQGENLGNPKQLRKRLPDPRDRPPLFPEKTQSSCLCVPRTQDELQNLVFDQDMRYNHYDDVDSHEYARRRHVVRNRRRSMYGEIWRSGN